MTTWTKTGKAKGTGPTEPASWGLERAEEAVLIAAAQGGDIEARNRLVLAHMPLVASHARRQARGRGDAVIGDLTQEGVFGLFDAIRLFDLSTGNRLSTLAISHIKNRIRLASVMPGSIVRPSVRNNVAAALAALPRAEAKHAIHAPAAFGSLELAAHAARYGTTAEVLVAARTYAGGNSLPLDAPRGDGNSLADNIADGVPSVEDMLVERAETERLRKLLSVAMRYLTPRQREVLEARWLCDAPKSLRAIGESFGISAERVRQIESQALRIVTKTLRSLEANRSPTVERPKTLKSRLRHRSLRVPGPPAGSC